MENPFEEIIDRLNKIEKSLQIIKTQKNVGTDLIKPPTKFLTINETSKLTNMKLPTIYKKVQQGLIPYIKKSGKLLFEEAELIAWLRSGRVKTDLSIENELKNYLKGGKL